MVEHYRVYRNHLLWLSNQKMQNYHDRISEPSFLHVHSIDAAQSISKQAFGRTEELAIQQTKTLNEVVEISKKDQRFLGPKQQRRDLEHKISRAVVDWSVIHQVGTLAIGDVRDVADGKRLNRKSQQKVSNWSHGMIRQYIAYKAEAEGNIDQIEPMLRVIAADCHMNLPGHEIPFLLNDVDEEIARFFKPELVQMRISERLARDSESLFIEETGERDLR